MKDADAEKTAEAERKLNDYIFAAADSLRELRFTVRETLEAIGGGARKDPGALAMQLIALRRYADHDQKRGWMWKWTWSGVEAQAYERTDVARFVDAEIQKVRRFFEGANPGYTLGTSPLRDLKSQLRLWNGNVHVQNVGRELKNAAILELAKPGYARTPDPASVARFVSFIRTCPVTDQVTSAVPGTSDHGQMRAVDFVVLDARGRSVAGTETKSIQAQWVGPRWHTKLHDAIKDSGSHFEGPLKNPYEPWHYTIKTSAMPSRPSGDWVSSTVPTG
jgi:hypothetical protein